MVKSVEKEGTRCAVKVLAFMTIVRHQRMYVIMPRYIHSIQDATTRPTLCLTRYGYFISIWCNEIRLETLKNIYEYSLFIYTVVNAGSHHEKDPTTGRTDAEGLISFTYSFF